MQNLCARDGMVQCLRSSVATPEKSWEQYILKLLPEKISGHGEELEELSVTEGGRDFSGGFFSH